MLPLLILLVEFVLLIFLGKIRKKIMDYTRSDELYFWGLFLKKSDSRQKMKQIKKKVLQTYRRSSLKNELLFWLEFTVARGCFYGSLMWLWYIVAFGNSIIQIRPAIIGFMIAIPPTIALPQQLYHFGNNNLFGMSSLLKNKLSYYQTNKITKPYLSTIYNLTLYCYYRWL